MTQLIKEIMCTGTSYNQTHNEIETLLHLVTYNYFFVQLMCNQCAINVQFVQLKRIKKAQWQKISAFPSTLRTSF